VAFSLLKKAKKARERAFILGYLGHLAVDTVAHNYYVPYKIILSYETLTLRHTYWEMRFDEKMDPEVWRVLEEIAGGDYLDLDRFLENNLKRTIFSFSTNKKIFNSLLIIQRMKKWRLASALLARRSSYPLLEKDVHHFRDLCFEVLVEFLQGPEQARVLKADPAGQLKLLFAKEMVRDLRRYTRRRVMGRNETKHFIQEIREKLSEGLYKPIDLPLITDAISAA
jgi:hypothetical protein